MNPSNPVRFQHPINMHSLHSLRNQTLTLNNYRPISNLSIFSKTLERIVAKQLTSYLISHKIPHIFQSAYLPSKSTETALAKISSDILTNLDNKNGTILALLDLSSAFDTIDHTILIHRLTSIGITGTEHKWLSSFITNRISSVLVHSTSRLVTHGVPQGSVLGPILFNIYIIPLLHLISNSPVSFHTYADDIQLYVKCTENVNFAPDILSSTITTIHNWLTINSLVFNPIKTEAIFLHLPLRSKTLPTPPPININGQLIMYSTHVKNLGIIFDNTFNFYRQLSHITKLLNYQLHSLRLIRHSISISTATIIASAYILPLFDYCNFILYNTPSSYITKLQILQNSIARCIFNIPKYSHTHISPFLVKLHWLPVRHQIIYKTLLLAHKAIHHDSPDYLASILKLKLPTSTTTRSTNTFLLQLPPKHKLHSTNTRSWAISVPYSWNTLPISIRTTPPTPNFKKLLKTYLFNMKH